MSNEMPAEAVTEDAVLGGRLKLSQPARGHRFGHDAILLAAACPARAGDRVVDLGAGVGAAGLALAARVERTVVTLADIDEGLVALAQGNAERNRLATRVRAVVLDAAAPARAFTAAGLAPETIACVLMNPPFNDSARQRASPEHGRRLAHQATIATLAAWSRSAARLLRPRGTLTLIWRADGLGDALAALAPAFGAIGLLSIHPKPGAPAIRVLLRATKGSGAPLTILPGLTLNDGEGNPTPQVEAVLRTGAPLALADL